MIATVNAPPRSVNSRCVTEYRPRTATLYHTGMFRSCTPSCRTDSLIDGYLKQLAAPKPSRSQKERHVPVCPSGISPGHHVGLRTLACSAQLGLARNEGRSRACDALQPPALPPRAAIVWPIDIRYRAVPYILYKHSTISTIRMKAPGDPDRRQSASYHFLKKYK